VPIAKIWPQSVCNSSFEREETEGKQMQTLQHGVRGLGLLVTLNVDRFLFVGTIALTLALVSWVSLV
jgi:hypothetical protein